MLSPFGLLRLMTMGAGRYQVLRCATPVHETRNVDSTIVGVWY